ncbi:MAG: hypothetical protein FJZ62_04190 [Chlamydiae bacterium]|nr:hypothetical protein [Chlamydiota bacterium]
MQLSQINIKQASDVFCQFATDRTFNQKKYIIFKNGQFELKELDFFDKISIFFEKLFDSKSENSLLQQIRSGMTVVSLIGRNLEMNITKTNLLGEIPTLVGKLYNQQFLKIADATFESEQLAMVAAIVLSQREIFKEVVKNSNGRYELKDSPFVNWDWKYKCKLHEKKSETDALIVLLNMNFFNSEKVVRLNEILKSEHEDLKDAINELNNWDTTSKDVVLPPLQKRLKQIEENKLAEIQRSLDEDSQRSGATTPTASKNPEIDRLEKAKNNFENALKIQKTLLNNCSSTARQPLLDSQMRMV